MIVYFSGTGNSRYCAQFLASKLSEDCLNAADLMKQGESARLTSQRPWVFAAPIYAWQMAKVFADFIRAGSFEGGREAYFVLTCGGEMGNAAQTIRALCEEKGFVCKGVLQVQMPENYVAMFPVPSGEKCAAILAAAGPVLEGAAEQIARGDNFPEQRVGLLDKLKSGPINKGFYAGFVSAKKFYTTDDCVSCGKCAEACVLNNITLRDGKPVWGEKCTHCMACICGCPVQAIEYGKASQGKTRYQCPEYREKD